jgi:hypothetical protein
MKLPYFRLITCFAALLGAMSAPASASDLTGTWKFSVDLNNGEHGEPVFVLKQANGQLTGVYQGPFGQQKVTGNIQGDTAMLEVTASGLDGTLKLSYLAKVESPDKMSGAMSRNISGQSTPGKWTATRSK